MLGKTSRRWVAAGAVLIGVLILTVGVDSAGAARAPATLPLSQTGTWLTDAQGRVVVLHGLNQVYKVAPYEPSADGFGADDAAFLHANGFTAMRLGVIWAAVEPRPGHYDGAYLDSIARTVRILAKHGIVSVLDFHQDLYNEKFQGEGAPAWAVQDGGLPNPALGFPFNYFANPAEDRAWDSFWSNSPAPDGLGLQDHYAAAWAHVAARFRTNTAVFGYEVLNEPWPGTVWEPCLVPVLGCPLFDATLSRFYDRVVSAIRSVDTAKTIWLEPNVLFNEGIATNLRDPNDGHTGFAFHDYCAAESELGTNLTCAQEDALTFGNASAYTSEHVVPGLVTEFGATNDAANLTEVTAAADQAHFGWLEWAYTGNDITSSSPDGQALVFDPAESPTGTNVNTAKLAALARPYPTAVAGTPTAWSFDNGVFTLSYTTQRAAGDGTFAVGSITEAALPAIQYPHGYSVRVTGAKVLSAAGATRLRLQSRPGARTISVTVTPTA